MLRHANKIRGKNHDYSYFNEDPTTCAASIGIFRHHASTERLRRRIPRPQRLPLKKLSALI